MKKILHFYDTYALKIGIAFLIIFTALYPKLPSVHIIRTWVYIRLEDFVILAVTNLWLIQLLRKKVKLSKPLTIPVVLYWIAGLASLTYSIIYIGPQLMNYFPHVAALNYLRRIEYMVLFFIALSTVKSKKDIRDYIVVLALTTLGIVLYGLGQRFYIDLWAAFPSFFQKYSFCFPSFQTGNEEYAKGIPLCLPGGSRITSTFGGHYDLAAYMVLVIPILLTVSISIKKLSWRIFMLILSVLNLIILIFTSSRVSFIAYIIAVITALIFYKKKLIIIPVIFVSILLLLFFSESTAKRLLATARFSNVVTNMQGQLIGETTSELPSALKNKISKNEIAVQAPPPVQNLPKGSGFIGLPQQNTPKKTNVAVVEKTLSPEEIRKLKITSGSIQITKVSGNFLIRKVLVYDISFTTRFQSEWPNAWKAFMRNPLFGSGYSTITLATDNSYFRALGETGLLGLLSFLFIFLVLGITTKEIGSAMNQGVTKGFIYGLAGGMIGLLINAFMIDVFEASKVAENMWILLGIGAGALLIVGKKQVPYIKDLKTIFSSNTAITIYLLILTFVLYMGSINNFFVADDFTNLRLAAVSSTNDILKFFTNSQNGIYDPFVKIITFFLFPLFSLSPQGYHVVILILHFLTSLGIYFLTLKLFKRKLLALLSSLIFLFSPLNGQSIYWYSSVPYVLTTCFIIYSLISFTVFKIKKSFITYIILLILTVSAFLSSSIAVIIPFILIGFDILIMNKTKIWKKLPYHLPVILILLIYFVILAATNSSFTLLRVNVLYPVSAALSMICVAVIDIICKLLTKNKGLISNFLLTAFILLILIFSNRSAQLQNKDWSLAGNFTKNMLSVLRLEYENVSKDANVYFIAPPEKMGSAWVLPAGLEDSLWFIYQDNNPYVYSVPSTNEAKKRISNNKTENNYIFTFEKDGDLKLLTK